MHFITALALLPLILGAAIPSPTPPCGTHTLPPPSDYSFQNVQIALRKPVSEPDSPPTPDICLHPGGPVEGPSAPSIGLFGGLKVGLVPCAEATYRWSVRNDGKGIVVGNGQDVFWELNAGEVEVGSDVTIREADQASPNQEWRLVAGNGQLRLGYTEGPLLCLEADEANNSVSVEVCGTDDAQDQAWVVLLMPQPVPRDIAARCPPPV